MAETNEEYYKRIMKRIKANDPAAMTYMGLICYKEDDYDSAFEYWEKAVDLGDDLEAHYLLGNMYRKGEGVEKDEEKEVYHLEKAAAGGHPDARHNLANYEERNGRIERSVKHLIIAANLGDDNSMNSLWLHFKHGNITKKDLEAAIRAHKAAVDATKSPERDEIEAERAQQQIQSGR